MFFYIVILCYFFSIPVPVPRNDSLWFPFPKCGDGFFSFPSRSRILGIIFSIPFPFPICENVFFPFPSLPEFREWNYPFLFPFPFPNSQKSFFFPRRGCIDSNTVNTTQHLKSNFRYAPSPQDNTRPRCAIHLPGCVIANTRPRTCNLQYMS